MSQLEILMRSTYLKPWPLLSRTADAAQMFAIEHWGRAVRKSDIPHLPLPGLRSRPLAILLLFQLRADLHSRNEQPREGRNWLQPLFHGFRTKLSIGKAHFVIARGGSIFSCQKRNPH